MVNNLCIVQARLTSSRLAKKVLMELSETKITLLEHIYKRLICAKSIDKVVFAIPNTEKNFLLKEFLDKHDIQYFVEMRMMY